MRVTVRGVDQTLWEEAKSAADRENKTTGHWLNEAIKLGLRKAIGQPTRK